MSFLPGIQWSGAVANVGAARLTASSEGIGVTSSSMTVFNRQEHLTVGEKDPYLEYSTGAGRTKTAIGWGQLKLLVSEMEFFNLYLDLKAVPKPLVVYVGSADGTHIAILAKLYPQVQFHLYDGRSHNSVLKGHPQITLFEGEQGYFTEETAKRYAGQNNVYLVVDIRNLTYSKADATDVASQRQNEAMVVADMEVQAKWMQIIRPVRANLKFRLPYATGIHRFNIEDRGGKTTIPYLDGVLYKQAWTKPTSTEVRLVPHPSLENRDWDFRHHEGAMYYHNRKTREMAKFYNPVTGENDFPFNSLGITQDWDSTVTIVVVMDYLQKFGVEPTNDSVHIVLQQMIQGANSGKTNLMGLRLGGKVQRVLDDDE